MWKLLSTDSGYYQFLNYIQLPVILTLVVVNSIWGNLEGAITVAMFILAMIFGAAIGFGERVAKSRRIRLLAGLPVPVRSLGLYGHFGTVVGWCAWMALLSLSSLISKRGHLDLNYLYWIVAKIGGIFIFAGGISLPKNLFFCVRDRKFEKHLIQNVVSPVLMILSFFGWFLYLFVDEGGLDVHGPRVFWARLTEIVHTFPGAFSVLLAGCMLLALDVYFFERRRSYLDDSIWPS
jgi:hypothetical protein